ncbi:hypothetical protein IR073_06250 [Gemella sp. 19428wG2_WT2a]|nr:hypothetical protein [Gemella sp. 19428wG2_WT2a]TFU57829.1 hypothetical protein E4T67_06185 [Gemella sp. WT2a]
MVVIKKVENSIPIDFGEFVLEFSISDESIKRLDEAKKKYENSKLEDNSNLDEVREVLKETWITLFSQEDYEKVIKLAGDSTINFFIYLVQTIQGIQTEIEVRGSLENIQSYM